MPIKKTKTPKETKTSKEPITLKVKIENYGEIVFHANKDLAEQLKANDGVMNNLLALNFQKAIDDTIKLSKYLVRPRKDLKDLVVAQAGER